MENPLVSIIVPVYRAEKYLRQCVDSILAQTFTDWECILVDDGSPDRSGEICDEYACKDSRIKVVHQLNGGVSVARQTGIDTASGKYTIHVDPDDWIDPMMLEELVTKVEQDDADMVICDFYTEDSKGRHYVAQNPGEDINAESVLKKILLQQLHGSCCNKLVKRACYGGIKFIPAEMVCFEDELFNIRLLWKNLALKISYMPFAYYHYVIKQISLSHGVSERMFRSRCMEVEALEKLFPTEKSDDLRVLKTAALFIAFELKDCKSLFSFYPEIRESLIEDGKPYSWLRPHASCLSIALRGYPKCAYIIFRFHLWTIKIKEIFDHVFRGR